jgi:hypothetical protein
VYISSYVASVAALLQRHYSLLQQLQQMQQSCNRCNRAATRHYSLLLCYVSCMCAEIKKKMVCKKLKNTTSAYTR